MTTLTRRTLGAMMTTGLIAAALPALAQDGKTLALVQINQQALFFNDMNRGAQEAADAEGAELLIFNANNDPAAQNSAIETYIQEGVDGIAVVGTVDGQNVQDTALGAAENLMTANPDLTAIYATGEPALLGAVAAVESQGRQADIAVYGWDLTAQAIAGIDAGYVKAVIQQDPAGMGAAAVTALGTLAYYAAFLWIIARTLTGQLSIGDLTFLSGSFLRLRGLLEGLLSGFSSMAGQAMYLDDLFDFFTARPAIASPADPLPVPVPIAQGFRFENVGFRYPGRDDWAIRGMTLDLRAGETVALVGENGAGKTTIVKLLARLYDPDEGRITLDGRDLRDYDLDQLRGTVGVIFQDFVRYAVTAAENIAIGRIDARDDRPRIVTAAERSLADQVIAKLPKGYDQMVGKRFARGLDLSGGEWQKLAIARAYMRDAQLLVLDEPTAALDARAEYEVFLRFRDLTQGRTALLISHRFSSVRMADRIIVLEGGRVQDQGSHAELVARPGRYRELFELQAQGYR